MVKTVFTCVRCDYSTTIKSNYKKHLQTKKHLKNELLTIENHKGKEKYKCELCNKTFTRKDNLIRHNEHHCKKVEIASNLQDQIDSLRTEIENGKETFKGILQEKDKYISMLKEQNKNMNQTTFQIIQNNIITMSPLKFLNTFCSNNPTLKEVSDAMKEMEFNKNDFKVIQEGIVSNNKTILGNEIDNLMKRVNKSIMEENNITTGFCDNVLFINDGSCRRFITKGDPGWDYYKNDDVLDAITCSLLEASISEFKHGSLYNRKERDTINKIVKSKNDYTKNKEEIVKSITYDESNTLD